MRGASTTSDGSVIRLDPRGASGSDPPADGSYRLEAGHFPWVEESEHVSTAIAVFLEGAA